MASKDVEFGALRDDIIDKQVTTSKMLHFMTRFCCTTCAPSKLEERSPEYLIILDQMTCQLYHLLGVMRDFLAEWPIECDCMVQLHSIFTDTFQMAEYLFDWYPNAYNIDTKDEGDLINLYDAIYKDGYKFHSVCIKVLRECAECHTFMEKYSYPRIKCIVCQNKNKYCLDDGTT